MSNSKKKSDQEILDLLKKGDERAFNLIYELYWEQLFISAHNMVKNREVCEDILQELFINLWKKREKLQINVSLKSYLYSSVLYKVYDHFRKNSNLVKVELLENFDKRIHTTNPESKLMHKELVTFVNSAINNLPEKSRIVFKLSREKQLSHKEIAEQLNISTKTVEAHITKSLKILKSSLGNVVSVELIIFIFYDMIC